MEGRPWFIWDLEITDEGLRARLRESDPDTRAQWQARVMREARYGEVWSYLTLEDVLRDWTAIRLHLGRKREFWEFLLDGGRADGLLPSN